MWYAARDVYHITRADHATANTSSTRKSPSARHAAASGSIAMEMIFACKKCKKCFRKDMNEFDESDEFCPNCDNHFVLEAKEPKARLEVEGEDARIDSRMIKDERVEQKQKDLLMSAWEDEGEATRLG
ncbi:hypothetical protein LTR56_016935 [Elasticomyces elasticus]|nr:hypothetical protein LTR56_016935 [Elasticomyces elasticus]KAK3640431.1 hypothetical protein LTR22_016988 [Elasticomyces elasticus]KAK4931190.1 hypothetical protein LTR49_002244 [Elasticomyces elasticus]